MIRPIEPADWPAVWTALEPVSRAGDSDAVARDISEEAARAAARGFRWMQFNLVASRHEGAVRLWTKHGSAIVGTLPEAFHHPVPGDVDAFVMSRRR